MNAKKAIEAGGKAAKKSMRIPVSLYLSNRIEELKKLDKKLYENAPIAEAVGFATPNIVTMLRSGKMRLPAERVAAIAEYLQLDPLELLEMVMMESNPKVWESIQACIGRYMVKQNEWELVRYIRGLTDGAPLDFEDEDFENAIRPAVEQLAKKQMAQREAEAERIVREKRSKLKAAD